MPKKQSSRQKDTQKKRKTVRAKAVKLDRTRVHMKGRKIHGRPLRPIAEAPIGPQENRMGLEAAGQQLRKIATRERAYSESVEQLAEEGQPFEAEVLAGVEEAEDSDEMEVTTHEALANDVPSEYDPER
jgi:hypothetical protein